MWQETLRPLCGPETTTPEVAFCGTRTTESHHDRTPLTGSAHRGPGFPAPTPVGGRGTRVTAVTAWGKRPVPSRTRKLRPTAPMVLHPGGCGRVGHRRTTITGSPRPHGRGLPVLNTQTSPTRLGGAAPGPAARADDADGREPAVRREGGRLQAIRPGAPSR